LSKLRLLPGLLLAALIALAATLLAWAETELLGRAWLEPMVLAILLGLLVANLTPLPQSLHSGADFAAKSLLDIAVALLGATLSWSAIAALGLPLFLLIATVVVVALLAVYALARAMALGPRLSILIASGNAICGNSAIAAVAPIVGAKREEITAAITLTALIGVASVLLLPFAVWLFGMALPAYALLVGLSVYAVPQVVAAAAPFGTTIVATATLVKLARVVMLGPLTLALSLFAHRFRNPEDPQPQGRPKLYLPWFILAFGLLSALRSRGLIDDQLAALLGQASKVLATIAMAALGLGVRLSALREVGPRVALASTVAATLLLALATAAALLVPVRS
jgi:uncharacterized integral membrane protein (TIGR00698 family)